MYCVIIRNIDNAAPIWSHCCWIEEMPLCSSTCLCGRPSDAWL